MNDITPTAYINLSNLTHNVEVIRSNAKKSKLMAVVKANAYGHGAIEICKHLNNLGVMDFAVSNIEEAMELRNNFIEGEILVLGHFSIDDVQKSIDNDITLTISSPEEILYLTDLTKKIKVH